MIKVLALIGLLSVIVGLRTAEAVFGVGDLVWDPTNWVQNNLTAIETTLTAARTLEIIKNQLLELEPLERWAVDGAYWIEDLRQLQELAAQGLGLAWELEGLKAQIERYFNLETAPSSSRNFRERQWEIRRFTQQSWVYAMQVQTLGTNAVRVVTRIINMYAGLNHILGNKQGLQTVGQYEAQFTQVLTELNLHTAALERAQSLPGISDPLIDESIKLINEKVLGDWAEGDTGQ